jgi:hypothetical protein
MQKKKDYNRLLVQAGHARMRKTPVERRRMMRQYRDIEECEALPEYEGIRKGPQSKAFRDYLSPISRWLQKQVGRKWSDVHMDAQKLTSGWGRQHVMLHALGPVYWEPHLLQEYANATSITYGFDQYYVDSNGFLRILPRARRERRRSVETEKTLNGVRYKKLDDKWYRINGQAPRHTSHGDKIVELRSLLSRKQVDRLGLT